MNVLMAMSGGVDSSVAAHLLIEEGHDVVGVTMKLWGGESDTGCCAVSDTEDARRVCQQLDIAHHVFNYSEQFERDVVEPYVASHAAGLTPNPCIECNRTLKFGALLERCDALGFDAVATGHHARIVDTADGPRIGRGADARKDQSYVLYPVRSDDLERVMFPIGSIDKAEVRSLAERLGLRTASKAESQDVCFITRKDGRSSFLENRIDLHPGTVVDTDGAQVGTVDAIEMVTLGQRRGLDVSGNGERHYARSVDVAARTVTVATKDQLVCDSIRVRDMVWASSPLAATFEVQARSHGGTATAAVTLDGHNPAGEATVDFEQPHRLVAPGQSVVFYDDDVVVGGAESSPNRGIDIAFGHSGDQTVLAAVELDLHDLRDSVLANL